MAKECIVPVENAMDALSRRSTATLVWINSSASRIAGLIRALPAGQLANLLPPYLQHLGLLTYFRTVINLFCSIIDVMIRKCVPCLCCNYVTEK